jgi:hypothetical protein
MGERQPVPFATTLQSADRAPYSRPYVAEYCHSDYAFDPRDRLRLADTCRADAAAKKRRVGSGLRQQYDGKHFWRSDRNGPDQGNRLSRVHFLWCYPDPDGAHG